MTAPAWTVPHAPWTSRQKSVDAESKSSHSEYYGHSSCLHHHIPLPPRLYSLIPFLRILLLLTVSAIIALDYPANPSAQHIRLIDSIAKTTALYSAAAYRSYSSNASHMRAEVRARNANSQMQRQTPGEAKKL
ncbi:unnamed protein product [Heligmosomoides polygyrus]|uniref:DUF148 domain-containing protein n=1 Tax=Heligmosomoides polygyrus TaxID=6339 RepID=A0A183GHM4_HELPZ|nr:unnamed protein product [Heligmosomoides polygyrus]